MTQRLYGLAALLACATCSNTEPAMSAPNPPATTILSAFTQLQGGDGQAIAPGAPLVTLGARATWWDGDAPATLALPGNVNGYGSRWMPDGKSLRVGLGTLDVAARAWVPEPALQTFGQTGRQYAQPVRQVAWFADATHVAMLIETRNKQNRASHEIVVATSDGKVRGRKAMDRPVTAMIAAADRVAIVVSKLVVLDLDAKVVAEPDLTVRRVNEGAGMFAATLAPRGVALVRPSDGVVVATWDVVANDAVPVPNGVVAVDLDGNVRVGCTSGKEIREVAKVASGARGPIIQRVGDRIVVMGGAVNPVWVAAFSNPCR